MTLDRNRAVLCVLASALALLALVPAADAYEFNGAKWSSRTITYYNTASRYDDEVKAAASAWNRSGVKIRWRAVPRRRAAVVIKIDPDLETAGFATFGRSRRGRVSSGRIDLRPDLSESGQTPEHSRAVTTRVVVHEMGHILGLDHENRRCATMNSRMDAECPAPELQYRCRLLESDDVKGAIKLYGGRARSLGPAFCDLYPGLSAPDPLAELTLADNGNRALVISWVTGAHSTGARFTIGQGECLTDLDKAPFGQTVDYPYSDGQQEEPAGSGYGLTRPVREGGRYCVTGWAIGQHAQRSEPRSTWVDVAP
jgi:hypothetical protein